MQLFNSIISPPHWKVAQDTAPAGQLQPHVQFSCVITESRLDDELSVAILELTDTPYWLQQADLDPYGFPKKTKLGTLWRGIDMVKRDADGQTEFMRAAISDDLIYAETLAEFEDTDVNVQDCLKRTALHWACERGLPNIVMLCLSVPGCDVSLRDHDNLTAFDIAMAKKDEVIPTMFYKSILELEERDPQGALLRILTVTSEPAAEHKPTFPGAALFQPIEERNPALIAALIARGVDLSARNADGDTALHVAVSMIENVDMAQTLLAAGCDVDASGGGGATALHRAVGTGDEEMIKALLQWKPDLAMKDANEKTAFDVAVQDGKHDISRFLLDHGADLTAIEIAKVTLHPSGDGPAIGLIQPLQVVPEPERSNEQCIDLRTLQDIQLEYGKESTAIHQAARNGDLAAVVFFLEHGASVDVLGEDQETALHIAAGSGHRHVVVALLAKGANIEAIDVDRWTALHAAAKGGHTETVTALLAKGVNIEAKSPFDWTALHVAAGTGHTETVTVLLANGANIETGDRIRRTPLHHAAGCGHTETVTVLLSNGANIEANSNVNWTALHYAAMRGYTETVTELLAKGARIEAGDNRKRTPLHLAIKGQHITTVAALLNAGANLEALSKSGTPVQRALKGGFSEIMDLLVAHGAQVVAEERLRDKLLHQLGWIGKAKRGVPTNDSVPAESGSGGKAMGDERGSMRDESV